MGRLVKVIRLAPASFSANTRLPGPVGDRRAKERRP
jgi:hypothetical protein